MPSSFEVGRAYRCHPGEMGDHQRPPIQRLRTRDHVRRRHGMGPPVPPVLLPFRHPGPRPGRRRRRGQVQAVRHDHRPEVACDPVSNAPRAFWSYPPLAQASDASAFGAAEEEGGETLRLSLLLIIVVVIIAFLLGSATDHLWTWTW